MNEIKWPRNAKCYCDSGVKYKKCCWKNNKEQDQLTIIESRIPKVYAISFEKRGKSDE